MNINFLLYSKTALKSNVFLSPFEISLNLFEHIPTFLLINSGKLPLTDPMTGVPLDKASRTTLPKASGI